MHKIRAAAKQARNHGTDNEYSTDNEYYHSSSTEAESVRAKPADALLKHSTISRDQTSTSHLSEERLAALAKPATEGSTEPPGESGRRETVIIEEGKRREREEQSDDIVEVIEEHSPVRPAKKKKKKGGGYRTVETPDLYTDYGSQISDRQFRRPGPSREKYSFEGAVYHSDSSEATVPESFTTRRTTVRPGMLDSNVARSRRRGNLEKTLPNRNGVSHASLDALSKKDLLSRLKALEIENQELKQEASDGKSSPPRQRYTWRTLHCINEDVYLDVPQWRVGESGPTLRADMPLHNPKLYLEQHPEIAFVFSNDYRPQPQADSQIASKDGVFRTPKPFKQNLILISEHITSAVKRLAQKTPGFSNLFPDFDPTHEIPAPYMFMYYTLPRLENVQRYLTPLESDLLGQLIESIQASHGKEYADADNHVAKGTVSKSLMKYLIRPGDVLVKSQDPTSSAYMATSWAKELSAEKSARSDALNVLDSYSMNSQMTSDDTHDNDFEPLEKNVDKDVAFRGSKPPTQQTYSWTINVWSWVFDGAFKKKAHEITIKLMVADVHDGVKIDSLEFFPIRFDTGELRAKLEKRGKTFWKCRTKRFVSYQEDDHGVLNSIGERYMIDIETYKTLHPNGVLAQSRHNSDMKPEVMARDQPPEGETILVFPPSLIGYNLRLKKWEDLHVDRVSDIEWNKQAFANLVANEKTKELVEALVTNRLAAEKSTDIIHGKGNGLIILLHGGPGTGKTFTAEGVAEIAEKPLYRVTCGDVGTKPEDVEKYLESVLYLGKIWDCVVLLDEADVFLEERGLADLQRNALVSVFLRVLEYNVGILILTSNRVGTFDEAFKSRIQLALHYDNLTASQQKKVWRNFLNRLKVLDSENIDFDDIIDHIDELGQENMNGRQIRNAITTARQLAQFKNKKFSYEHLKHVIEVGGEFERYLKALREGFSDDEIKREGGLR